MKSSTLLYAVCFSVIHTTVISHSQERNRPGLQRRDTEQEINEDVDSSVTEATTPAIYPKTMSGHAFRFHQDQPTYSYDSRQPILVYPAYPTGYDGRASTYSLAYRPQLQTVSAATAFAAYPYSGPSVAYQPQPVSTARPAAAHPHTGPSATYQPNSPTAPGSQRATFRNPNGYQGTYNNAGGGQVTPYQGQEKDAKILSYSYDLNPSDSSFEYGFETDNGLAVQAKGYMRGENQVIEGSYMAPGPEGKLTKITYTADENGYNPSGEGIPTIPPIIAKAIAYLKSLPPSSEPPPVHAQHNRPYQ